MILLGSTGSIGTNTLRVAKRFNLDVEVLVAGQNIRLLNEQIALFKPKKVVVALKKDLKDVNHNNVSFGEDGILNAIKEANSKLVVNALVGFLGLKPTLKAISCNKKVALANKESLVVAGKFIDPCKIIVMDSEHFGLWYLLQNKKINSMIITASGGSFRNYPLEKLKNVSIKEALNHPNWSMGNKITVDSATMTNKIFELIEAKWLFNTINLDAIIETKSLIHSFINFTDGSTTAHIANTSMELPISYALLGKVEKEILKPIDLLKIGSFEFKKIEEKRYPIWKIKDEVLHNPNLGVVVNAANEIAVSKFLNKKIDFLGISTLTLKAVNKFNNPCINTIEDIFHIDNEVRRYCEF